MIAPYIAADPDAAATLLAMQKILHEVHDLGRKSMKRTYQLAGEGAGLPVPESEEEETELDPHTPTVLVVEDDETTRLAMMAWLVGEGFSVLAAANGHEAAGHLERPLEPIDVVVLDVGLPDVDGVALCERIREMYPEMPVLVCSGGAAPEDVARLMGLGATRYFRKPVEADELLSSVEAALH